MKLTDEQRKLGLRFSARLEQGRIDRGNAILEAQKTMRQADPRPAEAIIREQRETEWK